MQGNLIDEAETESLFHEIRTKFITLHLVGCGEVADPYNRPRTVRTKSHRQATLQWNCHEATEGLAHFAQSSKCRADAFRLRNLHYLTHMHLVGCGDSTHRCARAAQSFRKICSTDRRDGLRSPAFEVCIGVTEPVFLLICVAFYPDKPLPRCHVTIHYIYKPFYIAVM